MAITDDLKELMTDTATWRALTGRDSYGAPTYGADEEIGNARLVRTHKLVRDIQGDQVLSTAHLWLAADLAIAPEDQVELSDGTTPPIVAIERYPDDEGSRHTKVFFR